MVKKYENNVICTKQEYDSAISAILGDKDPENCTSTVEVYAMFTKIAKCITDSSYYDKMDVVDSARVNDSIACIDNVLKSMIGDETLNLAIMSHLETLDDESGYDGEDSAAEDESSEESEEVPIEVDDIENDDSLDVEPIDLIEVWDSCHTTDFNDFVGLAPLVFIGRKHGFNHGYIAEQLLYIMHNYNIGCNKIRYIGAAITTDSVQKAFGLIPKAGDLVYFAYCKRPTFIMYASTPEQQWYIIYQCDKDTGTILGVYNKSDLDSVCADLNKVDVDETAFSNGFDELKILCRDRDIDFNMLYRKVVECYAQGANIGIDHISNIKFDVTKTFKTKAECIYAKENGSDGDLFFIAPSNKSNKKSGWMIFAIIAGYHQDKTRKLLQVDSIKIANHDETSVSSQPTKPKDDFDNDNSNSDEPISSQLAMNRDNNGGVSIGELGNGSPLANVTAKLSEDADDDSAEDAADGVADDDDDDIDVGSMRYMSNVDIKRKIAADRAEFIKKMQRSQRWNSTPKRARGKSSDSNTKSSSGDNNSDETIWSLDSTD